MSANKKSPLALIGEGANEFIKIGLSENGFNIIPLPADNRLAPQVSSHADMLLLAIEDTVFCNNAYCEKNKSIFDLIADYGYKICKCDFEVSNKYPNDVSLNQAVIAKNIIGREQSCAKSVLEYAATHGFTYNSINQGYAKCSTLILNEKAVISADTSVIATVERLGISALKIRNGVIEITLDGYDYGFIGGASAVYEDKVYFFGNLSLHTDSDEITKFCQSNGMNPISLGKDKLCDIGGAIILPYIKSE